MIDLSEAERGNSNKQGKSQLFKTYSNQTTEALKDTRVGATR
jgi:hypothetical protein